MLLPVKARGIPCFAVVTHFEREYIDHYYYGGYSYDVDYELVDRRGKAVPWIESKMTKLDWEEVENQIIKLQEDCEDYY